MRARLTLASFVSAAMILAAPLMGQIRAALRFAFPREFVTVVGGFVAVAIATAVLLALTRIRAHRPARYAAIAIALGVGAGYSIFSRSGLPEADWVERVHFIEYGGIALLFYRVWRPVGDPSISSCRCWQGCWSAHWTSGCSGSFPHVSARCDRHMPRLAGHRPRRIRDCVDLLAPDRLSP